MYKVCLNYCIVTLIFNNNNTVTVTEEEKRRAKTIPSPVVFVKLAVCNQNNTNQYINSINNNYNRKIKNNIFYLFLTLGCNS